MTFAEFGLQLAAVETARDEALIARYAGDPAASERVLRAACDQLRAVGETGALSVEVGELAEALYELGRYDEADEANRESASLAQAADVATQVVSRRVRAKLLARAGERDQALRFAHEAIEWAGARPEELGDAYRDLAEVEQLVGHAHRAEEALERALAAYEQKGMVPMAERTHRQLAELRGNR